jgi:CHAD domain-containing protein
VTGPRRDLDVFSHDLQAGGRFTDLSAQTVDLLSRELAARWDDVQRQIVDCLNGRRYRVFRNEWQWFLYRVQHNVAHAAPARPIQPAADAVIWRVYRKLLRQGKRAAARGRLEDIHAARKTCKKLRYLIEALRSLYPVKRTRKAIDALQQMQTALGTVCDLAVQVRLVDGWRAVLLADHPEYPEAVLELTAMRDAIDACGKEAIATFGPDWRSFVAEPNRRLYRGLFKPETT